MSKMTKKNRDRHFKAIGDHQKYISRITKSLYYGKFPKTDELSLPVTELAAEIFSESRRGKSLDRLHLDDAAKISRNACVSPCSLVLAILYLERLKKCNCDYLEKTSPADLFLVSLMVSCKFLYDDGADDEVFIDEWAMSGGITVKQLVQLEKEFLKAIEWEIFVNELTFFRKLNAIETSIAQKQGSLRGFFTYTELENLLKTIEFNTIIQNFATMSVILLASYAAALLTLLGSAFIVSHIPGTFIQPINKIDNQNMTGVLPLTNGLDNNYLDTIETKLLPSIENFKTDEIQIKTDFGKFNVLKTSLFLASIEGFLTPFCQKTNNNSRLTTSDVLDGNVQSVSWDWWNVPSMNWLFNSSDLITKFELPKFDFGYLSRYLETYVSKTKHLELEDHIQKATKTRLQDQLENSWHVEWSDTIVHSPYNKYLHYYLLNVKQ